MPRSIWNGTITFGLIAVPIKVHSATEEKGVHFHQVHAEDGARIRQKRICSKERKEVPYEEVAKVYEVADGEYVLLSREEIAAAGGERSRSIELEEFVRAQEIDPDYYDRTYYLGAREGGEDAYRLLHEALARTERVGVGRWVFHHREYLVSVRTLDGVLGFHTMRFADELVTANALEVPDPSRKPTRREIDMAAQLVDSLHDDFSPTRFEDTYRERVLDLIARKAKGDELDLGPPEEPEETPDLMGALEASLGEARSGPGARAQTRSRSRSGSKARSRSAGRRTSRAGS